MPRLSKRQSKALAAFSVGIAKPKDAVPTPSPRNCRLREIQRRRSPSREGRSPSRGGAVLTKKVGRSWAGAGTDCRMSARAACRRRAVRGRDRARRVRAGDSGDNVRAVVASLLRAFRLGIDKSPRRQLVEEASSGVRDCSRRSNPDNVYPNARLRTILVKREIRARKKTAIQEPKCQEAK